jgi:uncharacterized repeat protein (TIGR01451 family)
MKPSNRLPWGFRLRWIAVAVAWALVIALPTESRADALRFTEFPAGTYSTPLGITSGPDGDLWFAEFSLGKIGRMTPSGSLSEYDVPFDGRSVPTFITSGPDGNLWFSFGPGSIGRITPQGVITEYPVPTPHLTKGITSGPDGNLWFTEGSANKIGRITTSGAVTEFDLPAASGDASSITSGPDDALWYTNPGAHTIGRITTSGSITEFGVPTAPGGLALGPDGNLWFTETGKIGRMTPDGSFTEFAVDGGSGHPSSIASGPDGNLWFNDRGKIGRITTGGSITEFPIPYQGNVYGMTAGPDGNLWFTEFDADRIARLVPPSADLSVSVGANPTPVRHNNNLTYTVTVEDGGPDDATPVQTVQSLPSESKFVSANPSQGTCVSPAVGATGDVSCSLGSIATGASATIIVVVTVTAPAGSSVQSTVGASNDGIDTNPGNDSASVATQVLSSSSDLGISMSANPSPVHRNSNVTYSVFVTNAGPDAATLGQSIQQLPSESTFVSATPSQGSCDTPATGKSGSVTCSLGAIGSGGSASITVVVTITAPDRSTVLSTATVDGDGSDPNPGNNWAQVATRVCNLKILGFCL